MHLPGLGGWHGGNFDPSVFAVFLGLGLFWFAVILAALRLF
jgi:hypothetical protein